MADHSEPTPFVAHGGNQFPPSKMPGAVPNGVPPQWGQDGTLKPTLTSQIASSGTSTNGTRSTFQHNQPGSLSSQSSRDSSPAQSRIGVAPPSWSSSNPQNFSRPVASENPSNNPNQFQQHTQSLSSSSSSSVFGDRSQPAFSTLPSNYQPSPVQRMVPVGSIPPRSQQSLLESTSTVPPSSHTGVSTASSSFGPSVPAISGNVGFHSTPLSQKPNTIFSMNSQHGLQSFETPSSSGVLKQNTVGSANFTQAPSNQQVVVGQQQTLPSAQIPSANVFSKMVPPSVSNKHFATSADHQKSPTVATPDQQLLSGRQMPPSSVQQTPSDPVQSRTQGSGMQVPVGPRHQPPGALQQAVSSSESNVPSTQGFQVPSGLVNQVSQASAAQGHQVPLSSKLNVPPGSGQQSPSGSEYQLHSKFGQQLPLPPAHLPSLGQQPLTSGQAIPPTLVHHMPSGAGQQMPNAVHSAFGRPIAPVIRPQVMSSPGQQISGIGPESFSQSGQVGSGYSILPSGQQMYSGQQTLLRPSGQPPVQGHPSPMPSGPWSSTARGASLSSGGVVSKVPHSLQQGSFNAPLHSLPPNNSQQAMSMPTIPQPSQSVTGPPLQQHLQPMGQYLVNQNHLGHPVGSQVSVLGGNDPSLRRYPQHPYSSGQDGLVASMSNLSVTQTGFNKLWGQENFDLLQNRNILPPEKVEAPQIRLTGDFQNSANCSPDIFRCTLTRIPESDSLLKKSRLPFGVLIHPFKDLNSLPVIQCNPIVRCRVCRTYINPFVYFMDEKHWKCNLCFRVNELHDEFQFDPVTKTYGEPLRRPEVKSSTIEFIAPAEYMLRPPQPAVYLFLLDVSRLAVESGYLQLVCEILLAELDVLPGDSRTSVGFITFDSSIHFYSLAEGLSAPQQMVVMDIDDVFLPCPENLLANLGERRDLIQNMLLLLPSKFSETYDTGNALGAALQAAFKLMSPTGGRVTVFQCCLPNKGPGALKAREDPANRASKDVPHLNPATDFYKQLALEFSGQQTAVDLFVLNQQYSDLATISGVSRFSGGCIYHFPLFQSSNIQLSESFENAFRRYLDRKIGFEAVMRIRCSRGLSIHTFHGNFYVRSTDLLSLPNVNPDAGFGMQVSIEENLSDMQTVCFQAALLYTSGKGERRIRVHTLCLPIAASLPDILYSADQQCIIGLLAKMAVDRSQQSSLSDARDAFINVAIDALSAYKLTQSSSVGAGLLAPKSLRLLPLYILALLKNMAFRSGTNTRLDDRVFAMCQMKTLPLSQLIQFIYPDLYPIHCLDQFEETIIDNAPTITPPRLHLSAEKVNSHGAYLMNAGDQIFILVGRAIPPTFCENVLGVSSFSAIPEDMFELPEIDCEDSSKVRNFLLHLQSEKPFYATLHIIREDSKLRSKVFDRLIEDRTDSSLSYYEFLQHLKNQIK